MAVEYGTIAVVPMGTWENSKDYDVGNLVELDGSSYVAKVKPPAGMLPTDTAYWQISAKGASKATVDIAGVVKPDGVTTEVDANASLSVKKATQSTVGIVKGSDDIKVGADGSIDVDTTFTQATELANIIAGEAIASVLGKVSKAIAITMSLDQNALLKNMLTSIDGNSSEKVPTQAYIHTLVERIGMGTELTAGANLTEVANELSSNLEFKTGQATINSDWATGSANYYAIGKQCVVNALITLKQDTIVNNTLVISGLPTSAQEKVCLFHGAGGYGVFKVIADTGNITIDSGAKGNSIFYFEMIYPIK